MATQVRTNISALTGERVAELRAALEQQRSFRTEQLAALAADAACAIDDPQDEVLATLRAGAEAALADIDAAIALIEEGVYGLCRSCDDDIPLERLEILPMAVLCMRCAYAAQQARR